MSSRLGSATATVLSNSDLLLELFEHLAPFPQLDILQPGEIPSEHFRQYTSETYLRAKTLANAALACKDFTEPSSSVLWRVLYPGLRPLFYPFPGFHRTTGLLETREADEYVHPFPISNHVLEREPTPAEWERWKICVRRVRCINLRNTYAAFFEEPYIPLLLHASAGVPILPTIRSIIFNEPHGDPVQTQLLHALIGPTLSTISVYNGILRRPYSAHILDNLKAISRSCGDIQRLNIRRDFYPLAHNLPLSLFPKLRNLHLDLSWDHCRSMVYDAAALKGLETLFLSCDTDSDEPQSMSAVGNQVATANAFPALRTLELRVPAPEAAEILSSISSTSLQDLRMNGGSPSFRTEVPALLKTFPWKQNASSLRRFTFSYNLHWDTIGLNGDPFYAPFFNIFAPLTDLHALEYLVIECWSRVLSISDADVARMARSWPHLQHIAITYTLVPFEPTEPPIWDPYGPKVARPSVSALVDLAERCPALCYCDIPAASMSEEELVALEAHAAAAEAENRPRQTNLRSLTLAYRIHCDHFTLPDADRVARALLVLLPSLYGVDRRRGGMARWKVDLGRWSDMSGRPVSEEHRCLTDVIRLLHRIFELSGQEVDDW